MPIIGEWKIATAIQINPDWLIKQDEHTKAFRWYWFSRGIDIKANGQIFDARGKAYYGKTYEEAAREYAA